MSTLTMSSFTDADILSIAKCAWTDDDVFEEASKIAKLKEEINVYKQALLKERGIVAEMNSKLEETKKELVNTHTRLKEAENHLKKTSNNNNDNRSRSGRHIKPPSMLNL